MSENLKKRVKSRTGVTVRQKVKGKGNPWTVFINHKGKRQNKTFKTKKAADEFAQQMAVEIAQKDFNLKPKNEKTFGKFSEEWLKMNVETGCKKSTLQDYEALLKNHINPVFGDRPINDITRGEISDFLNGKMILPSDQSEKSDKPAKAKSRSTVLHMKAVISGVMKRALDHDAIQTNPVHYIKVGKKQDAKEKISPFTQDQLNAFLKIIAEDYSAHHALFCILAHCGLRLGEALALRWSEIDFDEKSIEIRRSFVRGRISTPKSGKFRKIEIEKNIELVLRNHMQRHPLRLADGKEPLLFANADGNPMDKNNLRKRVFQKALEKLVKVPELKLTADEKQEILRRRIHDLRHTYATHRIANGDDITDVSYRLGHYSPAFTMNVYTHWSPGKRNNAMADIDIPMPKGTSVLAPKHAAQPQTESKKGGV